MILSYLLRKELVQYAILGTAFAAIAMTSSCGGTRDPIENAGSGSTKGTGGAPTVGGASTASGGSSTSGGGGTTNIELKPSDLPAAGSPGVAQPAGTPSNLVILNWAGFKGAVTYTFDDANSSQIAHYSELKALNVRMTFYIQTGKSEASNNTFWAQAVLDGHELGNHTQSHPQTASAADIDAATTFIQTKYGVKPYTMAAPFGNSSYVAFAKERFIINRGVSNALVAPKGSSDPFNLPCYIPGPGAPASDFNSQIDSAQKAGNWRIVLVHGFIGGSDNAYQAVDIGQFTAGVEHAKSLGDLWIDSMVNVGSYWLGQKLLAAVAPTTSGSDQVWSWTLPANFPPNKYLRVTVDGGTLKQGGRPLSWNDHGYYEVALDAGSLTLSP